MFGYNSGRTLSLSLSLISLLLWSESGRSFIGVTSQGGQFVGGVYEWGLQSQNHAYVYGVFRVSWKDVDPQRAFFWQCSRPFRVPGPTPGPYRNGRQGVGPGNPGDQRSTVYKRVYNCGKNRSVPRVYQLSTE